MIVMHLEVSRERFVSLAASLPEAEMERLVEAHPELFWTALQRTGGAGAVLGELPPVRRAPSRTYGSMKPAERQARVAVMDEKIRAAIEGGAAQRSDILDVTDFTDGQVRKSLARLKDAGRIFMAGEGRRSSYYGVTQAQADERYQIAVGERPLLESAATAKPTPSPAPSAPAQDAKEPSPTKHAPRFLGRRHPFRLRAARAAAAPAPTSELPAMG